ncbi:DUF3857 domain-containing protein [Neolewinella litorea]|uniref:Transglutaminase domain-containing protein n=1 Tax=Neolewinella litorea TaxID=2562452 RepID=A0A4S4NZG3_9BACT|nr:DUF3857 domain-containing protein [Neolewinella litorea]THH41690.1 transglutaminase domain-containing protein [Neolewinella litorea]
MIRPCLLFLFIWAGAQVQGQSEALGVLALPDSLRQNANSVVMAHDLEYRVTSLRSATILERWVVTLLNSRHDREDLIIAAYDGESKINTFEVAATDLFGREFFRAKKGNIQDERVTSEVSFLEDRWVRYTKVPCTAYPCTIAVEIERKLTDFAAMAFPHWSPVQRDQSLVKSTFTAYVPNEIDLLYASSLVADPQVSVEGKDRIYRWTLENIPAQPSEPLAPVATETLPYVRVALGDFQIENYRGSFSDWSRFGSFIGSIMTGRDQLPDQLAAEVHAVVEGAATDRERVDRLYRFMQTRCRYVSVQLGIGGWQPFSATYVDENRYGDCKALSNYMGAMLKEVGIASYPVLINSSDVPYYAIREDFATSAFNHMVLYVPSEEMYLECTSKHAPTGYLGESTLDRGVLWITPEGGRLARTPSLVPSEHGHLRSVTQTLDGDNAVEFELSATYFGGAQELFRELAAYFGSTQDRLDWLHRNNFLPDVSGSAFTYTVAEDAPEVTLAYNTTLNSRVRKMGSRRFFALNPHPYTNIPDPQEERRLPVDYRTTRFLVDTVRVHYDESLEIESGLLSEALVYEHAVGEYRAEMRATDEGLLWIRTLLLRPALVPAEEFPEFRQFFVDVAKAESIQLVFRERRTK